MIVETKKTITFTEPVTKEGLKKIIYEELDVDFDSLKNITINTDVAIIKRAYDYEDKLRV